MEIKEIASTIKRKATSGKGKTVLTFLVFLIISTLFWFLTTLNETVQRDYRLEVKILDIPKDVKFISNPTQFIDVSVKDKGRALIKYDWGTPPLVNIKYSDFIKRSENNIIINREMLSNNIRNSFGSGCEILSIRPDSINLVTTTRPGDRLPVFLDITASTKPQFINYGQIECDLDSVTVYSVNGLPASLSNIRTEPLTLRNLTDTTSVNVHLVSPTGTRVSPSVVKVTIPVEPLVAKKRVVTIQAINYPKGKTVHLFPSSVELNYLVPMSMFKNDEATPKAIVDFRDLDENTTTIPVKLIDMPDYYRNCVPVPAEVEYLVES